MKLLISLLTIIFMVAVYFNFSPSKVNTNEEEKIVTNSNKTEENKLNYNASNVLEKVTNKNNGKERAKVVQYKDVFKEPQEMQTDVEKISENEELRKIDNEVKALILEADSFIEEKNLELKGSKFSKEEQELYQNQVDELEKKLDKLETK